MRLEIERRPTRSRLASALSPLVAVGLTVLSAAVIFLALGKPPLGALETYFVEPLTQTYYLEDLVVKATPLVLMAVGLALCYLSNNWNIGAEGQYVVGAVAGSGVALAFQGNASSVAVTLMLLAAAAGGALYALIPAVLKVWTGASEILTSLMLVYIAGYGLDWLVRGPWRDPAGFNFPQTVMFDATLPTLLPDGSVHLGAIFAMLAVAAAGVLLWRSLWGFELLVLGQAPRAGLFAGFSPKRMTLLTFIVSGALAGLAGIGEVAGSIGQLQPSLPQGYGFTAIIVAFLGRLNPFGILVAGLLLSLSYIGGEHAQESLQTPIDVTRVIQGLLLFFVLACDTLVLNRVRLVPGRAKAARPVVAPVRAA